MSGNLSKIETLAQFADYVSYVDSSQLREQGACLRKSPGMTELQLRG
jgi:hypothetical protein